MSNDTEFPMICEYTTTGMKFWVDRPNMIPSNIEFKVLETNVPYSRICEQFHVQCCHKCDDLECGDNTSPEKSNNRYLYD